VRSPIRFSRGTNSTSSFGLHACAPLSPTPKRRTLADAADHGNQAVGTYAGEVHLFDFPSMRTASISNRHGRVWCVQYDPMRDRLVLLPASFVLRLTLKNLIAGRAWSPPPAAGELDGVGPYRLASYGHLRDRSAGGHLHRWHQQLQVQRSHSGASSLPINLHARVYSAQRHQTVLVRCQSPPRSRTSVSRLCVRVQVSGGYAEVTISNYDV
jgi:hypothetical protein